MLSQSTGGKVFLKSGFRQLRLIDHTPSLMDLETIVPMSKERPPGPKDPFPNSAPPQPPPAPHPSDDNKSAQLSLRVRPLPGKCHLCRKLSHRTVQRSPVTRGCLGNRIISKVLGDCTQTRAVQQKYVIFLQSNHMKKIKKRNRC